MIRKLYEKYQDKILYLVFGALTTAVNTGVFWLCAHPLGMDALPSTMIAWLVAVIFAYITNRNWVFHSEASTSLSASSFPSSSAAWEPACSTGC